MATSKTTDWRERNTAIHEAGHAVAAYYLHQRIRYATIVPNTDTVGRVTHWPLRFADHHGVFDDSLRGIDRAEKHIVICYAGALAVRKAMPGSKWRVGAGGDFETAAELISHLQSADDKYNRLYAALIWRRAELLVDLRWKDINAVADDLLQHRTLSHNGVSAAIDRAHGLKPLVLNRAAAGDLTHG